MGIFSDLAPHYWAVSIPAMPLKQRQKVPILSEWQNYGEYMPSSAVRTNWLDSYAKCNIGLPFGPASGLCAIDIDTTDKQLIELIMSVLPASPWVRVGKKGMALIFKWSGQKNFKIGSKDGMIVEFLGHKNQMVLPGSIHPDCSACDPDKGKNAAGSGGVCIHCGTPSTIYASNVNLWDVMDQIVALPLDIEDRLRRALSDVAGVELQRGGRSSPLVVVPEGTRDINLVRHAGYLARVVRGIDKNVQFSLREAMEQMYHWVEAYTVTVAGDDMDPNKGVAKLLEFLVRDVEAGATLPNGWDTGLTDDHRASPAIAILLEKNEATRWTMAKARAWISKEIEGVSDDDIVLAKIQELVALVAKDEQFTEFEFQSLVEFLRSPLVAGTQLKVPKSALVKLYKTEKGIGEHLGSDHEEIARTIIEQLSRGGELRYAASEFWQWSGSHFDKKPYSEVYTYLAETVKGNVLVRRDADYKSVIKVMTNILPQGLIESDEVGVNFANGFLDAHGVLHAHDMKYGKTFTMPFNYVPSRATECHKWMEYLERAWGDDEDYTEKVMALQEAFAATMFGIAPDYQRVFLLHGQPGTGKTQALEVLQHMMPDNAQCTVGPDQWGERFGNSQLVGKALNVCGELPEFSRIVGNHFKAVVDGSAILGEFKGRDTFTFRATCAHWFGSNHLPSSHDSSEGFTRRWLVFDFTRRIPEDERVANFHEVLINEEQEAIAAWAVQGMKRLIENSSYTIPASSKMRQNQMLRGNNSVAAFVQTCNRVRAERDADWDLRELFDTYMTYMKEISRGKGYSLETFGACLGDLGYKRYETIDEWGKVQFRVKGLRVIAVRKDGLQLVA